MPKSEPSVDEQLKKVPATVRPMLEAARRLVKATAPDATETAYGSKAPQSPSTMWKLARYALRGQNVVGIGTFTKHSTLFFYQGRELDDGSGLLQGGGKEMRFITLNSAADAERPEVKGAVSRAFKLARG